MGAGALLLCAACILLFVLPVGDSRLDWPVRVKIEKGWSLSRIAGELKDRGLIQNTQPLVSIARITGHAGRLKAGTYRFERRLSLWALLNKLTTGDVVLNHVTLPEGLRAAFMAGILSRELAVDSTVVMALVSDSAFCRSLGVEASSLEGYLYPDTYYFEEGVQPEQILTQMVDRFHQVVGDSIVQRARALGFTLHKIVTLASIIEGEVVLDSERPLVSAVYHNRLKKRMYLQACPTVQYLLPEGPRRLLWKDLDIDSPYNTYRHFGLPPGPVGNPGIASIKAACYPAETDVLYLVAKGDGSHVFSRTLNEHLRAKARFDQVRRDVKRNGHR